jgi:hypothetical protein
VRESRSLQLFAITLAQRNSLRYERLQTPYPTGTRCKIPNISFVGCDSCNAARSALTGTTLRRVSRSKHRTPPRSAGRWRLNKSVWYCNVEISLQGRSIRKHWKHFPAASKDRRAKERQFPDEGRYALLLQCKNSVDVTHHRHKRAYPQKG